MAAVDLTHIIYRANEDGDIPLPKNITSVVGGSMGVSLAGIKYRSKQIGDAEE
jgi:hypothetical protein